MEKGVNQSILEHFGIPRQDIRTYSPLALAYIGDGIYEAVIRSMVVGEGNISVNRLSHRTCGLVNAKAQARMAELLLPDFTEEEADIYRRGRNAKSPTMPKHATVSDYRRATGFEALIGYLYLQGADGRLLELVRLGVERYAKDAPNAPSNRQRDGATAASSK